MSWTVRHGSWFALLALVCGACGGQSLCGDGACDGPMTDDGGDKSSQVEASVSPTTTPTQTETAPTLEHDSGGPVVNTETNGMSSMLDASSPLGDGGPGVIDASAGGRPSIDAAVGGPDASATSSQDAAATEGGLAIDAGHEPPPECVDSFDCARPKPLCSQSVCIACDEMTNLGCLNDTPWCLAGLTQQENKCVACREHKDCTSGDSPACQANECVPCSVADNSGCSAETPICLPGDEPAQNYCVECATSLDCVGDNSVCENNICIPCSTEPPESGNDTGCGEQSAPRCLAGGTPDENQCVECLGNPDCTDAVRTLCRDDNQCVQCESADQCSDVSAPHCDDSGTCAGCSSSDDCTRFSGTAECAVESGKCVECTADENCPTASAAACGDDNTCQACSTDDDCAHIDGKHVCNAGMCVECTATNTAACGGHVCDTRPSGTQFTCSGANPASSGSCDQCVSDAQCMAGSRCVQTSFGNTDTGFFCFWKEGDPNGKANCLDNGAPFSKGVATTSVDGESATYCELRFTTCDAQDDFLNTTCSSDAECGIAGLDDGLCRSLEGSMRCTYQCLANPDCSGGTCNNNAGTPNYCSP
ncbi:MAG TPA: hypothetical protein VHM70_29215 [Polyangiaceae bacterium]|nr:hypothetical protein [Polyangiaceae bacterium]